MSFYTQQPLQPRVQVDNQILKHSIGYRDASRLSTGTRMDFSGLFSTTTSSTSGSDSEVQQQRRRRSREPLQFEAEFDSVDVKSELSMEALHFFGLCNDTPESPSLNFDHMSDGSPFVTKRQRHFSLEDYNAMDDSDDSNLSMMSAVSSSSNIVTTTSKRSRRGSFLFPNISGSDDSAVNFLGLSSSSDFTPKSSGSDVHEDLFDASKFFSPAVQESTASSMSLELDNDHIAQQLRAELESRLIETICPDPKSQSPRFRLSLQLPAELLSMIASHIVQEAADEPYGLKGCLLHIYFESDTDCEYVASLDCDPDTVSTFELKLTLRPDNSRRSGWRSKLPDLVRSLSSFNFGSVLIGTSYKLVKRRNYSNNNNYSQDPVLKL